MAYFPWAMGRDADVYPDPLEVKPERWIPFTPPDLYEFPVFQAGPRQCLGMSMALFEAKLLTAMLVKNFTFSIKPEELEKVTYSATITMCVKNGPNSHKLLLKPKRRQGSMQGLRHLTQHRSVNCVWDMCRLMCGQHPEHGTMLTGIRILSCAQ